MKEESNRLKKESVKLGIGQLKLLSLRTEKKENNNNMGQSDYEI